MSLPKKDKRIAYNMRLPSKLLALLKQEAAAKDRSCTSIVVEMLHERYAEKNKNNNEQ